jgi:hypothetical protein
MKICSRFVKYNNGPEEEEEEEQQWTIKFLWINISVYP